MFRLLFKLWWLFDVMGDGDFLEDTLPRPLNRGVEK